MNYKLVSMFNKALEFPCDLTTFKAVNEMAMKMGYLVHPDCCGSAEIIKFLENETYDPNSTFYKTFEDVVSKDRFELALDQLRHYASTYGAGVTTENNGWIPNAESAVIPFEKYKIIMPCTEREMFNEVYGMLKSGIALHEETLNVLMEYLKGYNFLKDINVDEIKNKEAQAIFADKTGFLPKQPVSVLRAIIYKLSGSTAMLVKSKQSIAMIQSWCATSNKMNQVRKTLEEREIELASIFYRYKPIFLAMKTDTTKSQINRIRKLAVKYHKPMKVGFWERCFDPKGDTAEYLQEAGKKVAELTTFKKVCLMQGITERLNGKNINGRMFVIRNGKTFVRDNYKAACNTSYLMALYTILENSIVDTLKPKAVTAIKTVDADGNEVVLKRPTSVKLPNALELVMPSSEKNFVGNYPMGTAVDLSDKDNVIGVYWRGEWGVDDYDLHYVTDSGHHYGWNSKFYAKDGKIVFSGDMTRANPEAAECYYFEKNVPDGVFSLSKYSGDLGTKFKLFVAVDPDKSTMKRCGWGYSSDCTAKNAMVDPNKIVFEAELTHNDYSDKVFAKVHNGKLIMQNLETGGGRRVPSVSTMKIMSAQGAVKAESFVLIKPLLIKAGFNFVDEDPDIDLTQMSKNDLIKLVE